MNSWRNVWRGFRASDRRGQIPSGVTSGEALAAFDVEGLREMGHLLAAASVPTNGLAVCDRLTRVASASGCAVFEWDDLTERHVVVAAAGTWAGRGIEETLGETACDWVTAALSGPVGVYLEGVVRAVRWSDRNPPTTSAFAVPIGRDTGSAGVLLLAFDESRAVTPREAEVAEFLAGCAAVWLRERALRATIDRLSHRIARLIDDVERLLVAGRRQGDRGSGER
ncbi:MAG: hypothetical protein AB1778_07455 [Candidatus Bipolaricaulota bacterium]